ncbi:MAG: hypothetical protein R3C18_05455 [Planctomycetaceae bacterium]
MKEDGVIDDEEPTDAEVRKYDRKRKGKKVSNQDWKSPTDAEARIVAVPNVPRASVCKSNAARKSNGVSLTCARRAVRDAHGCEAWKRLPNGTHSS